MHTPEQESPLHEHEHIRLRAMIHFVVWFIAIVVVVHIVVYLLFALYRKQAGAQNVEITGLRDTRVPPPAPWLQPSLARDRLPREDMEEMRRRDLEEFRRRGWVDETGKVRVSDEITQRVAQLSAQPATRSSR